MNPRPQKSATLILGYFKGNYFTFTSIDIAIFNERSVLTSMDQFRPVKPTLNTLGISQHGCP